MTDIMSPGERSAHMKRVRTKDTAPENAVRRALHRSGFRFSLHRKDLPGTPDIVLPRHNVCLFIHGCFWHGHPDCRAARLPATRTEYWRDKIEENRRRDFRNTSLLEDRGWRVHVIWECETKSLERLEYAIKNLGLV